MCINLVHKEKNIFTNWWGMTFDKGHDDVVIRFYYQKWGNNEFFFITSTKCGCSSLVLVH